MALTLTDEQISRTGMTKQEILIELACGIYLHNVDFTLGLAAELAGIGHEQMLLELGSRKIPFHYYVEDLLEDVETLNQMHLNDSGK